MRPQLYAVELTRTIDAAVASRAVLDISVEAERISNLSGFSALIAATDLVEAGLEARINMRIPALHQLRRAQAINRHAVFKA